MNTTDLTPLPARPDLEQYKKQAKDLVKLSKSGDAQVIQRIKKYHPRPGQVVDSGILCAKFALADAQLVIAREHGFESWPKFAKRIHEVERASTAMSLENPVAAFIEAAIWHGTLERAEQILASYPQIAQSSIHVAAILGDDSTVRRFIALDPANA